MSEDEEDQMDQSDWIASLTCMNALFNGNLSCYAIGFDKKLQSFNK